MANTTGSFVSPLADATVVPQLFQPSGLLGSLLGDFNVWKALLTLFIAAVIYDQCESSTLPLEYFPSCPSVYELLSLPQLSLEYPSWTMTDLNLIQSDTSIRKDPLLDQDGSCLSWDLSFSRSTPSSTSTRPNGTAEN